VLKANGKLERRNLEVGEAHRMLSVRGLYQAKALDRGAKKLMTAIGMNNMRIDGYDPREQFRRGYNTLHNTQSVNPLPDMRVGIISEERQAEINRVLDENKHMERTSEDIAREHVENIRELTRQAKERAEGSKALSTIDSNLNEDNLDCGPEMEEEVVWKEKMTPEELRENERRIALKDQREAEALKIARPINVVPD
jgi:hypothetical protein